MPRRSNSRKSRSQGIFDRFLYGPVHQVLGAAENVVAAGTNTGRNVVRTGLRGVNRVGKSVTVRANSLVRGVLTGKSRRNRQNMSRRNRQNMSRRNRQSSRRNRQNSRRN